MIRRVLSCIGLWIAWGAGIRGTTVSRRPCTVEGFYDAGASTQRPCPGALPCTPGFYCTRGRRYPCPEGSYGAEPGLLTSDCSGPCPAGFFCPLGTAQPLECGDTNQYCPVGSTEPRLVPQGYYSVGTSSSRRDRVVVCEPGFYCSSGSKYPCPAGVYGKTPRLSAGGCTAPCPAGHYCPAGTISPIPCPPGTYGANSGATDEMCSGLCREGYYCPKGSISPTTHLCGTGVYCPRGSASPQQPKPGEYVINGDSKLAERAIDCPIGSFCTSVDGSAVLCPPGTYGDRRGLTNSACSGLCAPGYYCPRGSTSATAVECGGANVYCPKGAGKPVPVSIGYYSIGKMSIQGHDQDPADSTTRSAQRKCEPGNYCAGGVRTACPGGTFGSSSGLTGPQCSGLCQSGYYCPTRSIAATVHQCGSSNFYCPEGSASPTRVDKGFCSVGGGPGPTTNFAQRQAGPGEFAFLGSCYPCPAGTYGSAFVETNPSCSGECLPGYYCPPGSSQATERECGNTSVYCPTGAKQPLRVNTGFYTSVDTAESCPPGRYRDYTTTSSLFVDPLTGRSPLTVNYGDTLYPLAQCMLCPDGTFKQSYGDDVSLCAPCPTLVATSSTDRRTCECFRLPGGASFDTSQWKLHFTGSSCDLKTLSWVDAAPIEARDSVFTRFSQFPCERGLYCVDGVRRPCPAGYYGDEPLETRPLCSGKCSPGFFCPLASTNSTARPCGDGSVYCPVGSGVPRPVTPGYYTIRSAPSNAIGYVSINATANARIRDAQQQCDQGYYCIMGLKFICPGGRYGDQLGETSPLCAGPCKRGFYCPPGSTTATQLTCGGDQWVCRTGSPAPIRIPAGYYSIGDGRLSNTTRFHQQPCEPGYYCSGGVKYQCPAGTYGATSALATPECSGRCSAGYYCPSYPYAPSTSANQFECGNSTVYCPEGTGNFPRLVGSGNYSVGAGDGTGDARNTTRVDQQRCPRGSYCRDGIRIRCPEGTYGDREGLTSTQCSGWCPAGYFCPPGTADYRANSCVKGSYATAGSAYCMPCGVRGKPPTQEPAGFHLVDRSRPCVDKRECCFFG